MKHGTVFFLLVVLVAGGAWIFWPGWGGDVIQVDVVHGTTAHQVADELFVKGAIRTKYPFLGWIKIRGGENRIRIGRYKFSKSRAAYWIVDDLLKGKTQKITVLIPEGFSSWQIAERLDNSRICSGEKFLDLVRATDSEGFLFPATYQLDLGLPAEAVLETLRKEFDRHWTDEMAKRAAEFGWTKKEAVTMASIIEREVMNRAELPLVSALYHNRLKKNMPLEADPTVQYALGYWKSRLFYSDYRKTKSPYNTYLNRGLPPGPICSPGADAIRAALWPGRNDALYMIGTEDGTHDFSKTYREHVNKVNQRNRRRRSK